MSGQIGIPLRDSELQLAEGYLDQVMDDAKPEDYIEAMAHTMISIAASLADIAYALNNPS